MSPLRWFRSQATWMLIIFGALLMAIFGLGPVFDNMARGFQSSAGAADDPVVIEYRGGKITRTRLDELQSNHHATSRFLRELLVQASKQCEQKEVQFSPLAEMIPPLSRTDNAEVVDEQILVRQLLAERAVDEGVVISDGMIDDYLTLLAGQAEFSKRDWKQINKLVNQRTPLTAIRNHLRTELKSMQMQRFASIGIPLSPTPTEAVELYSRANDLVECEIVPVSVDEYVSKVSGEPGNSEMKAMFEEGKYEYESARKLRPGFKIPRKVNVQYFVAELNTFLENEKAKLTDAQVEAEYEKLVAAEDPIVIEVMTKDEPEIFNLDSLGLDMPNDKADAAPAVTPDADKTDDKPLDLKPLDLDNGSTDDKAAMEKPVVTPETEVPVLKMPEAKIEEPVLPNAETIEKAIPAETKEGLKVKPSESGGSDQSLNVTGTKSQFASFVQEAEGEQDETKAAEGEQAATEEMQDEKEVGGIGDLQLSDESAGPQAGDEKQETRVKPLAEVADEIRERLSRVAAFEKKEEATKRVSLAMRNYEQEILRWENSREKDITPKPSPPNFQEIADQYGLVFEETGLVDPIELRETRIGKVNFLVQVQTPQGAVRPDFQSVSNKIFIDYDRVDILDTQSVNDLTTSDSYIFWMSEKVDVEIPEFNDAKEKIKEYWKHQQAVELAKKAAQEMADKANQSGERLTKLFPNKAAPTGEFTWFRPGRASQAVYGIVYGAEQAGEEFMNTAFSLENGKASIAANEPRDKVFVIQRITPGASVAESGKTYLNEQFFRFKRVPTDVMGAAQHYARELDLDWNQEFVKSMGLKRMK